MQNRIELNDANVDEFSLFGESSIIHSLVICSTIPSDNGSNDEDKVEIRRISRQIKRLKKDVDDKFEKTDSKIT